jgi:hypothetical protein
MGWFALGTAGIWALAPEGQGPLFLGWWSGFFLFSVADLGTLAGLVGALLTGPPEGDRARWMVRLGFLGVVKLGLLGVAAFLLTGNRGIPSSSLLSGLGTLIVVPLVGGGLWSFMPPDRD